MRAQTYTEVVLDASIENYANTIHEPAEKVVDEAGNPTISPTLLQRIWQAAIETHKKVIRFREKRAAVRAERRTKAADQIAQIKDREEKAAAEAKEKELQEAYRLLDEASDHLRSAQLDELELKNTDWPGAVERRKQLIKHAQQACTQASAERNKIKVSGVTQGGMSMSAVKRYQAAQRTEEAALEYLSHLEGSVDRAPTEKDGRRNVIAARVAWDKAEAAVIAAEAS
ncbi:hypothetical protein [Paeniglutamicibacter sp.]|uniref:hypothetical protein n=1 Tax=Paeniglutamicibacter sp. TaxID=1934391 RepID=UPI003988FEB8